MVTVGNEKENTPLITGDLKAFESFIDQYKAYVFAIIMRFVSNPDDVQDIAQEVFLQLYHSLPRYRPEHLKAWVGKITINKAIDWKRKRNRQLEIVDHPGEMKNPYPADLNPEQFVLRREREVQLKDLFRELPPGYRKVIVKYHFEGKSYQEIAREEGISLKTVESRLYRARKLLRERWKEIT